MKDISVAGRGCDALHASVSPALPHSNDVKLAAVSRLKRRKMRQDLRRRPWLVKMFVPPLDCGGW